MRSEGISMLSLLGLLLGVSATAAPAPGAADMRLARPGVHVVVRLERGVVLEPLVLSSVTSAVREIWRPYVDVTFAANGVPVTPRTDVLTLVFTDRLAAAATGDGDALGAIEFVNGRPSTTVRVSVMAVTAMLERAVWMDAPWQKLPSFVRARFLVGALSHAAAHEIGHFLLASPHHAPRGLMRAGLSAADVLERNRAHYRLDRAEIDRLRRGDVELALESGVRGGA